MPDTDDMLRITPPRPFMTRTAWRQPRNVPSTLTLCTRRHVSSVIDSIDATAINDPGVVDEDVEPAAARDHPVHNRLPGLVLGDVEPLESKARSVGAGPLARCGI